MDRLILGFRRSLNGPPGEDFERQAAAELAVRIAEGRPPADAWRRRPLPQPKSLLGRTRHRPPELPGAAWYVAPVPPATRVEPARRTRPFVLRAVRTPTLDPEPSSVGQARAPAR